MSFSARYQKDREFRRLVVGYIECGVPLADVRAYYKKEMEGAL